MEHKIKALLSKDKLPAFKLWLREQGIRYKPGRGVYQILLVNYGGAEWAGVYRREGLEHEFVLDTYLKPLLSGFLNRDLV